MAFMCPTFSSYFDATPRVIKPLKQEKEQQSTFTFGVLIVKQDQSSSFVLKLMMSQISEQ